MASLFSKVARFASSPQGRRLVNQAKEFARDPRRQAQAKEALAKLRARSTGKKPPRQEGHGPAAPPRDPGPDQP